VSLEVKKIPGAKITTEKRKDGPPVGKPVSIEVTGDDYVTLLQEAEKIKAYIDAAKISGIDKLELEAEVGKPELILNIDREKAQKFGLSTVFVAATLRNALFGKEVSKFKEKDEDFPIQLRFEEKYRYDLQALMNQKITFRDNKGKWHQVPVASVADIQYSSSFGAVKRKNLDKLVVVSSNILEGYNANEIVTQIKTMMKAYKMKEGYNFRFGGEQEEQAKSMAFLTRALLIALAAVFMIIVWQFNSAIRPAIIMISVLLSTIGVFLGLAIFKMDFVIIMTGIGIISLAGVVVNNAIVLIDYTDLLKNRKLTEQGLTEDDDLEDSLFIDALVEAGYTRLRPVLLTAITTVLGLIPLATGMNIDFFLLYEKFDPDFYVGGDNAIFWGPMAWTVIFGLTFATFLTLVIVPVMYLLVDRMNKFFKKIFA
jgi:multidrug efflux pump subunit AcrB